MCCTPPPPPPKKKQGPSDQDQNALSKCIQHLRRQHLDDLILYRTAHQDVRNRVLHWIMIPIECWSALGSVHLICMSGALIMVNINNILLLPTKNDISSDTSYDIPPVESSWTSIPKNVVFIFGSILSSIPAFVTMALGVLALFISSATHSSTTARFRFRNNSNYTITTAISAASIAARLCLVFHACCAWSFYWILPPPYPANLGYPMSIDSTIQKSEYRQQLRDFLIVIVTAWSVSWIVQVGVGHWMWERNQPNVANIQHVSLLAMCQSVLIAWSS